MASKTNTKVKGAAETDYRTGNVNITPGNVGALDARPLKMVLGKGTGYNTQVGTMSFTVDNSLNTETDGHSLSWVWYNDNTILWDNMTGATKYGFAMTNGGRCKLVHDGANAIMEFGDVGRRIVFWNDPSLHLTYEYWNGSRYVQTWAI